MTYTIEILRRERGAKEAYTQRFLYEPAGPADTVATALRAINAREPLLDDQGREARPIEWASSCLQKKCGACAMRVQGRPRLACDARLSEWKGGLIRLEPLRKFPVVCDLVVDRSILFENLKTLELWLSGDAALSDARRDDAYEASGCIQCGLCLEVCPNFYAGGPFFGRSTVPVTARLLNEMSADERAGIARLYAKHTFEGCGKSLACRDVCPKHIDTERMLVNANALAVWKRRKEK